MPIADTNDLSAAWQRAGREDAFWEANRADLTGRYPDQVVAVVDEHVIGVDADLFALAEALQAKCYDLRQMSIAFMRSKSPPSS